MISSRSGLALCALLSLLSLTTPARAEEKPQTNPAASQGAGEELRGEDLRKEVSGSTIGGFHLRTLMRFSEYHSPDGRILGHNGGVPVDKGCWEVKDDQVCYYYEGDTLPQGTWCWNFRRLANANQYRLEHDMSGAVALAYREAGNPHDWSDNGKPWQCSGLISQRRGPMQSKMAQFRR
ncbi:hypothetical protein [Terrarubrum flagellatum]|uniref:hypothetical protein n=1 Tax=Terrirubrum flagellatum TaxID=2895980 RepID=UPI0031450B33